MRRLSAVVLSVVLFASPAVRAQGVTVEAKRKQLDFHLENIRVDAYRNRTVGGGILLGLGVASGIGGALVKESDVSTAFWVLGGIFGVTGALVLLLPTDYELLPEKYQAMADRPADSLDEKVAWGESTLRQLSDRAASQRYLGGGTSIAVGIALMALGDQFNNGSKYNLYSGLLLTGVGVVQLLVKSLPEREYAAYQDWLRTGTKAEESRFRLAVAPAPKGGMVGLSYGF